MLVYLSEWFRSSGRLGPEALADLMSDAALRLFSPVRA
jgi:hypothetical protein